MEAWVEDCGSSTLPRHKKKPSGALSRAVESRPISAFSRSCSAASIRDRLRYQKRPTMAASAMTPTARAAGVGTPGSPTAVPGRVDCAAAGRHGAAIIAAAVQKSLTYQEHVIATSPTRGSLFVKTLGYKSSQRQFSAIPRQS